MTSRLLAVLAICSISPALHADVSPVTDVECVATDGNNFPVTISWTNEDPDGEYSEHEIVRDGVVIATLVGGTSESYTDVDGGGGTPIYTVNVYSESLDCLVESFESCLVKIGAKDLCASSEADFVVVDLDADEDIESVLDTEPCLRSESAFDGTTDNDISAEDDRADITDLHVLLYFSSESVDSFTWSLTSPEGTELTLWDGSGGSSEWGQDDAVQLSDYGATIPDDVPENCAPETCEYLPAGPGTFDDFYGEDANGEWTLDGSTTEGGTLHDWCLRLFFDETAHSGATFIRGDVNGDGEITALRDALHLLLYYFGDGSTEEPPCFEAADADGNGSVAAIIDALRLLQHFFGDADAPPAPYPACGRTDPGYEFTPTSGEEPCETPTDCDGC